MDEFGELAKKIEKSGEEAYRRANLHGDHIPTLDIKESEIYGTGDLYQTRYMGQYPNSKEGHRDITTSLPEDLPRYWLGSSGVSLITDYGQEL